MPVEADEIRRWNCGKKIAPLSLPRGSGDGRMDGVGRGVREAWNWHDWQKGAFVMVGLLIKVMKWNFNVF